MPFGLKVAPSLFQKAMTKIFAPILDNALICIDDILLFSPDDTFHAQLLDKFQRIVQQYGIMLQRKRYSLYIAQPHIAQSLADFPDANLSKKQIQYCPAHISTQIDAQKKPHTWSQIQTNAVQALKIKAKSLPTLKIPSNGKKILQIDASEQFWSAILLEEKNGTR
ncbi:uncharacterized protein LOC111310716 [Durio zibethinus]|uniref:Uncharacterized protein LOC111310716 n=1 Tax=Durio zibethinus TaxID=66656 RepID=A0A6P6AM31_DURZI|nr:uncharacterized protein LOC111310716 [Durio zibethinus]